MSNHTVLEHFRDKLMLNAEPEIEAFETEYDQILDSMPLLSPCGQDCQKVIDAAAALNSMMPDVDVLHDITTTVARQCAVFITG